MRVVELIFMKLFRIDAGIARAIIGVFANTIKVNTAPKPFIAVDAGENYTPK